MTKTVEIEYRNGETGRTRIQVTRIDVYSDNHGQFAEFIYLDGSREFFDVVETLKVTTDDYSLSF